ncbi:hypothetical protein V2J09_011240 [Rumex salicifolius]
MEAFYTLNRDSIYCLEGNGGAMEAFRIPLEVCVPHAIASLSLDYIALHSYSGLDVIDIFQPASTSSSTPPDLLPLVTNLAKTNIVPFMYSEVHEPDFYCPVCECQLQEAAQAEEEAVYKEFNKKSLMQIKKAWREADSDGAGKDHYKLGKYSKACAMYRQALQYVPSNCVLQTSFLYTQIRTMGKKLLRTLMPLWKLKLIPRHIKK